MQYNFCPQCGSKLQKCTDSDITPQVCPTCAFIISKNSKPCVGVFIIEKNEILLARRAAEPFKGYWDIPGGFLEAGEHPEHGVIREIKEETGLDVAPAEFLGVYMDTYGADHEHTMNLCYRASIIDGQPQAASDVDEIKWFPLNALPDKIAFTWIKEVIDGMRGILDLGFEI